MDTNLRLMPTTTPSEDVLPGVLRSCRYGAHNARPQPEECCCAQYIRSRQRVNPPLRSLHNAVGNVRYSSWKRVNNRLQANKRLQLTAFGARDRWYFDAI